MVIKNYTFPQKVKTQNRIVIPKLIAEELQIKPGDNIIISVCKAPEV